MLEEIYSFVQGIFDRVVELIDLDKIIFRKYYGKLFFPVDFPLVFGKLKYILPVQAPK